MLSDVNHAPKRVECVLTLHTMPLANKKTSNIEKPPIEQIASLGHSKVLTECAKTGLRFSRMASGNTREAEFGRVFLG